jgi:hypothetical protein
VEYRIVMVQANERLTTDMQGAAESLAREVAAAAAEGCRPQGGVAVATTPTAKAVYLMQAMVRE